MESLSSETTSHHACPHVTQEQLADKIGTKKSYISRVENGHTDIQVSTLFKIF